MNVKWMTLVKLFAPLIISVVKPDLSPIAQKIGDAISDAEEMKGATGPQKLAHVQGIADKAADVWNAVSEHGTKLDKPSLAKTVDDAVTAIIDAANIVVKPVQVAAKLQSISHVSIPPTPPVHSATTAQSSSVVTPPVQVPVQNVVHTTPLKVEDKK